MTFLFWNIGRKGIEGFIARLVADHEVDIVILAESTVPKAKLLQTLNEVRPGFHLPATNCKHVTILTRFAREFTKPLFESRRVSISRVELPAQLDVLLAAVHLPSQLYNSRESLDFQLVELAGTIRKLEARLGHSRTILVGDLNANPFDHGVVAASGLNGVMTRQVAARRARTVQGTSYPFFYNPMWGHYGDRSEGPSGTYYYERAEQVTYHWNMFDQVLLRPDLVDRFDNQKLTILTRAGAISLVDQNGRPDLNKGSDHLPLLFQFDLKGGSRHGNGTHRPVA